MGEIATILWKMKDKAEQPEVGRLYKYNEDKGVCAIWTSEQGPSSIYTCDDAMAGTWLRGGKYARPQCFVSQ